MHHPLSTSAFTTVIFAIIENNHWRPGISDATSMGVIIFVCYFIGAAACLFRAWRSFQAPSLRRGPFRFWLFCGIALFLFGVNKQLDLHQLITQYGREWARAGGWYEDRRVVQSIFINCLAGAAAVFLFALIWALRGMPFRFYVALTGLILLGVYVLIRAASFHHVDHFLGLGTEGFRLAWLVELGGIVITATAALLPDRPLGSQVMPATKGAKRAIESCNGE